MVTINKNHLWWIVPLCLIIGFTLGSLFIAMFSVGYMEEKYPIIACLYNGDMQMNIDGNKLPITKESQMRYLERRCAEEFIDLNINSSDILQIDEE